MLFRIEVLRLAQTGLSPKAIAFALKCSVFRVYRALVVFDWAPRYLSYTEWSSVLAKRALTAKILAPTDASKVTTLGP